MFQVLIISSPLVKNSYFLIIYRILLWSDMFTVENKIFFILSLYNVSTINILSMFCQLNF